MTERLKVRLSVLYFLQFAVWGSYLSSLGQFLGAGGLGKAIAWFYAAIGLVSILTPSLFGYLADRYIKASRLLGICHLAAAALMTGAWVYSHSHPVLEFGTFYTLYLLFLAFYMPTMALANTVSFGLLKSRGQQPVDAFPAIRVWGTIGFVAAMWFVNSAYWHDGVFGMTLADSHPLARFRFQYTSMQLLCAGIFGFLTAVYTLTLPAYEARKKTGEGRGIFQIFSFKVLREFFRLPDVRGFLIFVAFVGVCLQISNGYATPFISHFMGMEEYAGSLAAGNATMLFSLSQIAEACFLLVVGKALKRYGIGVVFGAGILAWCLRFLFFGVGNPGDGLGFLVMSMIVYGVAFNFITIAGHLYMEQISPDGSKGLGQGVMMLMSNGVGATAGTIAAGEIINRWCHWEMVASPAGSPVRLFMGDWPAPWMLFAGYAFLVALCWLAFRLRCRTCDGRRLGVSGR